LRERSAFRPFWAALSLSWVGDCVATTALVLYLQSKQGTGVAVAALLLTQTVPRLLSPIAGTIADRTNQKRLLIGCDLGQAALYLLTAALLPPFGVLLALVAGASILQTGSVPARGAIVPALVARERLFGANALIEIAFNLQFALGPLAGGVLFAATGVREALVLNVVTFLGSAIFLSRLGELPRLKGGRGESLLRSTREGISYAARHARTRTVILAIFLTSAFLDVNNLALVFLVRETLDAGPVAFGIAFGAFGIGMLAASAWAVAREPRSPARMFLSGLGLCAAGILMTGLSPAVAFAVGFQAIGGVGNALSNIAGDTILQREIPRERLGRVFGLYSAAAFAGYGLSSALGGPLLDVFSAPVVLVAGGIGGLLVVLVAVPALLRESEASAAGA
jgi:MFS family permease